MFWSRGWGPICDAIQPNEFGACEAVLGFGVNADGNCSVVSGCGCGDRCAGASILLLKNAPAYACMANSLRLAVDAGGAMAQGGIAAGGMAAGSMAAGGMAPQGGIQAGGVMANAAGQAADGGQFCGFSSRTNAGLRGG